MNREMWLGGRWWRVENDTTWHVKGLDCFLFLGSQRRGEESSAPLPSADLMPKQTRWPGFQEGTHLSRTKD